MPNSFIFANLSLNLHLKVDIMTHKELISEVQRRSRLDKHEVASLLTALERVLTDAALDQQPVSLGSLGTFSSHKHPEYVQENAETGETLLCPPRITCRIDFKKQ